MGVLLRPDLVVKGIHDIDLDGLKEKGIDTVFFDLDNTIVLWNDNSVDDRVKNFFDVFRQKGLRGAIVSNNYAPRIEPVATALGLPYVENAKKPLKGAMDKGLGLLGATAARSALVGDQLMTDILCANQHGMFTILVNPMGKREFKGTKINRFIERIALFCMGVKRPV